MAESISKEQPKQSTSQPCLAESDGEGVETDSEETGGTTKTTAFAADCNVTRKRSLIKKFQHLEFNREKVLLNGSDNANKQPGFKCPLCGKNGVHVQSFTVKFQLKNACADNSKLSSNTTNCPLCGAKGIAIKSVKLEFGWKKVQARSNLKRYTTCDTIDSD